MKKGYIIINAFNRPKESVLQAQRIKEEFEKLGVKAEIVSGGLIRSAVIGDKLFTDLKESGFVIYLDKDKYTSAILDSMGIKLFNNHKAIRVCDDKGETYIALAKAGIKIPDTVFGALSYSVEDKVNEERLKIIADKLNYPVIVKESFGSMGKGVYKANNFAELKEISQKLMVKPHLYQRYLPYKFGTDVRVIVIGGKAISAIERINEKDFRSNVALGGKAIKFHLTKEFKEIAEKSAKALNLDYCGVDILFGDNGEPVICEVNSNAFFFGMESATGVNIAKIYAEYVIKSVGE